METVVSVFGVQPLRIGGVEALTKEISLQAGEKGCKHVAVFGGKPVDAVARYLDLPNLSVEVVPTLEESLWRSLLPLDGILKRHRPRVLHLHFVDFLGPVVWLGKLRGAKRIFFTAHGSNPQDYVARRAPLWKRAAARTINYPLTGVFCVSDYVRKTLNTVDLIPPERVHCSYESIELPDLKPAAEQASAFRRRFKIAEDAELIAQVSWMIPEKGVPDVLDAAKIVTRRRPKAHFVLAGNGDYLEAYRRRAGELGIGDAVTFTGTLENPMQDGVYAAADVFCLASRWQEAFGWVLAEAMSFEKPVAATRVGGIPDVVEDEKTGLLSPAGDPAALAENLLRLLEDAGLRRRMGCAGRERVAAKFQLRPTVRGIIEHYGI